MRGDRLLLFLRGSPGNWKGAGWGDRLDISFAWLDPEGPFARQQIINPGPLRVARIPGSTEDLMQRALHLIADRAALAAALAVADEELRARAIVQLLRSGSKWRRGEVARQLLQRCGKPGFAAASDLISDEEHVSLHPILAWALDQEDPAAALPLLQEHVRREVRFWKAQKIDPARYRQTAPSNGWLAQHYRRAHMVLQLLHKRGQARGSEEVEALLTWWDQHPKLDEWLRYTVGFRLAHLAQTIRKR